MLEEADDSEERDTVINLAQRAGLITRKDRKDYQRGWIFPEEEKGTKR
jgi:hypothetical protein